MESIYEELWQKVIRIVALGSSESVEAFRDLMGALDYLADKVALFEMAATDHIYVTDKDAIKDEVLHHLAYLKEHPEERDLAEQARNKRNQEKE